MKESDEIHPEEIIIPNSFDESYCTNGEEIRTDLKSISSADFATNGGEEETDVENFDIVLQKLEITFCRVSDVINNKNLSEKDNFELIKFDISVTAVHTYNWIVYRRPQEIKTNLEVINISLKLLTSVKCPEIKTRMDELIMIPVEQYTTEINLAKIKQLYKFFFNTKAIQELVNFKEFLNISNGSFNQYNNGTKPFEGHAYKRADPHTLRKIFAIACKCIECCVFNQYNRRWFVLKDDMIYYNNESTSKVGKNVYFFDTGVTVEKSGNDCIILKNVSLELGLRFKTLFERELWFTEISQRVETYKKIIANNIYHAYTNEKRNNLAHWFSDGESYFKDLSEKLMAAKETVFITDWWLSPEVWLTRPVETQYYMALAFQGKLKNEQPPFTRLMDILNHIAKNGVKIYILIYFECTIALTLNSEHSQVILENLHPNIKVTRHPENALDLMWSHHEKLVIIDQTIAYVGGLDLCWGRYDTNEHVIYEKPNSQGKYFFPGIDYSNARIRDFDKVQFYLVESANRDTELRMPWHDVHSRLIGPVAADIARHFVERWNHARFGERGGITEIMSSSTVSSSRSDIDEKGNKTPRKGWFKKFIRKVTGQGAEELNIHENNLKEVVKETEMANLESKNEGLLGDDSKKGSIESDDDEDDTLGANEKYNANQEHPVTKSDSGKRVTFKSLHTISSKGSLGEIDPDVKDEINKELGEDKKDKEGYQEEYKLRTTFLRNKTIVDKDHLMRKSVVLQSTPRKKAAPSFHKSVANVNFIYPNYITAANGSNENPNAIKNITYYDNILNGFTSAKAKAKYYINKFSKDYSSSKEEFLGAAVATNFFEKGKKSTVQVLRSASKWSAGIKKTENSILQAYYNLIDNSKYYLYIENQFFVSKAFTKAEEKECKYAISNVVENMIAYHIRMRIIKAWEEKKAFRVFIFIPLLPGFAGEPEESSTLQIILKHTYAGINRNYGLSIVEQCAKVMGDDWKKYIGFYSLRNHAVVNGVPSTELIYIHSKLMIVDDMEVILGSANINDRSMLGNRDSEYAVLIKERKSMRNIMDGQSIRIAKFAYTFRKSLMAEHLGLDVNDKILNDPLDASFWMLINNRAKLNTTTYFKIFRCYPDDYYTTFKLLKEYKPIKEGEDLKELKKVYDEESSKILGHIVEFPLKFLENEKLGFNFFSRENLVPERNFT